MANSLVGTITNAEANFISGLIRLNMMEPYAPVLPVPVCAWANMSPPFRPTGMDSICTGVGSVHPMLFIALMTLFEICRSVKDVTMFTLG